MSFGNFMEKVPQYIGANFAENLPHPGHVFRNICLSWDTLFIKCALAVVLLCDLMGQPWPEGQGNDPLRPAPAFAPERR